MGRESVDVVRSFIWSLIVFVFPLLLLRRNKKKSGCYIERMEFKGLSYWSHSGVVINQEQPSLKSRRRDL